MREFFGSLVLVPVFLTLMAWEKIVSVVTGRRMNSQDFS